MAQAQRLDPDNHRARRYALQTRLYKMLEETEQVTIKELTAALMALTRIDYVDLQYRLRDHKDQPSVGSSVRKYSTAFQAHDARRRKALARSAAADADGDDLDLGDDADDNRDSA